MNIGDISIFSVQSVLALFGIFGHINILIATFRRKQLQTKYGVLLFQLSVSHLFCITGEMTNTVFLIWTWGTTALSCFYVLCLYLFFEIVQAVLMLFISVDLLIAILAPMLYRDLRVRRSVMLSIGMCSLSAGGYCILALTQLPSSNITYPCRIYSIRTAGVLSTVHNILHMTLGVAQIICYATCYFLELFRAYSYQKRNPNACYRNRHKKTMQTISVLITVYLLTWFASLIVEEVAFRTQCAVESLRTTTCVLQMVAFSQTFYVAFWRSSEYRNVVKKIWKTSVFVHFGCHRNTVHPVQPAGTITGGHQPIKTGKRNSRIGSIK